MCPKSSPNNNITTIQQTFTLTLTLNLFVLGGEIANFEAPTPRDDMVSRARRGRAAQPWLSAVEGAVAKSDPMHAGTRATFAKLRFFTVLGQVVFRFFRSKG